MTGGRSVLPERRSEDFMPPSAITSTKTTLITGQYDNNLAELLLKGLGGARHKAPGQQLEHHQGLSPLSRSLEERLVPGAAIKLPRQHHQLEPDNPENTDL